jgi:hypothetical protein
VTDSADSPESPEVEEVRRLLADARHTGPMPDDVVARMDDVLAGLRREAADAPVVVPLYRRRRTKAAGMLVAAAVIVVGGVVAARQLPSFGPEATSAGSAAGQENAPAQGGSGGHTRQPGTQFQGKQTAGQAPVVRHGRVVVHPGRFTADALAGRRLLQQLSATKGDHLETARCPSVPSGAARVLEATYERAPAALVYRRPSDSSQVVDLYVCGTSQPIRSTTLPAP